MGLNIWSINFLINAGEIIDRIRSKGKTAWIWKHWWRTQKDSETEKRIHGSDIAPCFIIRSETLSKLADKGTVIVCDEPFMLIAVFPHPPSGWIHFATDNIEFFKDNFWRTIKRIGKNMVSLGINSLRIGLRERGEHEYVRLFTELGFKIYERIPIMEKYDYDIPDRGCQDVEIRRGSIEDVDSLLEIENLYFPSGHRYSAEEFKKTH